MGVSEVERREVLHPDMGSFTLSLVRALGRGHRTHAVDDVLRRVVGFEDVSEGEVHLVGLTAVRALSGWPEAIATPEGREGLFGRRPSSQEGVIELREPSGQWKSGRVGVAPLDPGRYPVAEVLVTKLTVEVMADACTLVERWDLPVARVTVAQGTREKYLRVLEEARAWGSEVEVRAGVPEGEVQLRADGSVRGDDAIWAVVRIR